MKLNVLADIGKSTCAGENIATSAPLQEPNKRALPNKGYGKASKYDFCHAGHCRFYFGLVLIHFYPSLLREMFVAKASTFII